MTSRFACRVFAFALFCMLAPQVNAQEEIPEEVHKLLGKLVGNWDCESVVEGQTMKWQFSAQWTPNKQGLFWNSSGDLMGKKFTASGIVLWDGFKRVLVECGGGDGGTFNATHHVLSDEWTSPTSGTRFVDGKYVHGESLRHMRWKSDDEWEITATADISDGKPQPKAVTTLRRKR